MYQPIVSVSMTPFNREKYIGEAIESKCEKDKILENQKKIFFLNVLKLAFKKGSFKKVASIVSRFNKQYK